MYLALPESITNEQSQGCSRGTPYRKTQKATFQKITAISESVEVAVFFNAIGEQAVEGS